MSDKGQATVHATVQALVAVCRHRPFNVGHVGWGYRHEDGRWRVGAVEGVRWRAGNHNGFWDARVDTLDHALDLFARMHAHDAEYDGVKLLRVRETVTPNPHFADEVVEWVRQTPYRVIDRNCMDSAYDILRAYAPGYRGLHGGLGVLPKPEDRWLPRQWYDALPAVEERQLPRPLAAVATAAPDAMKDRLRAEAAAVDALFADCDERCPPRTPGWRIPGHHDYLPPRHGPGTDEAGIDAAGPAAASPGAD